MSISFDNIAALETFLKSYETKGNSETSRAYGIDQSDISAIMRVLRKLGWNIGASNYRGTYKRTAAHRAAISAALRGKPKNLSPEVRAARSARMKAMWQQARSQTAAE